MALSDIDVKIIGDYLWDEDCQAYHEGKIEDFKYYFKEWVENLVRIPRSININFNIYYNPAIEKFSFISISTRKVEVVQALKNDLEFSRKYFVF
ncbi:hypothetical protein [Flavobacterium johnsoniae]|uniref:Uncharacterized protein n=1 Tax=Flavobacterium johnsoniae TaxID=986 RepID=A0A1M5IHB2_FLAJO|nr:hypothetical protein [Flavobacterium johnsoniae]SHG27183.1 hypothetical protein SAMN05444388_10283 [Flavobacterium johnsoniae]